MTFGHKGLQWLAVTFALAGTTTLSFAAAPVISGAPGTTVAVGSTYTFTPVASDADGDPLTFNVWNKPAWATFTPATGRLQGTPGAGDVGTTAGVFIGVTDGNANTWLAPFNLTVTAAGNTAPAISGTPPTSVPAGAQYSFQPTASDPDGDPLTFNIWNKPAWATFTPSTGRLQGTPGASDVGTTAGVFIGVTDGKVNTWLAPFNLTVTAAGNTAPTISGAPPTSVLQGTQYSFQPTASDPDGDPLTFTVWNKPAWAAFTPSTGRLQGTPGAGDVGTTVGVFIGVTDGKVNTWLAPFNLAVTATGNTAPTISGTPPTSVLQGTQYSFQPIASDPDGDPLTFIVWNKPAWATFTPSTGRLQGTPGAGDIGTTAGVFIGVTDGKVNAWLAPFNLTVQAVATGSATLSWQPPTQNTDGSPLTNLAGYRVYWGTSQGVYPNAVTLNNPGLSSYVVGNLLPGTYYFVVTSFNSVGGESSGSNSASKTIP